MEKAQGRDRIPRSAPQEGIGSLLDVNFSSLLEQVISGFDPSRTNRYFLFGSSTRRDDFADFDLGVLGNATSGKNLSELRDRFYESTIPFKVDVVDFDSVESEFRDYVDHHETPLWIN